MFSGIGIDIVKISRIQNALNKWGLLRFCRRIMDEDEIKFLDKRFKNNPVDIASYVSGRYF